MNLKIKLKKYLNENLKKEKLSFGSFRKIASNNTVVEEECMAASPNINNYINKNKNENTFQKKLFEYIDKRNLKDSDVYNKVNIDRRLFSKIRNNENYHPSKETVILLGLSLELNEEEIEDLLKSASYSLPKNSTYDLIIRFCFKEKIYNINQINEFLYDYNQKTLN